ncbi:MAG: acyl-CoA dehydrogenase family protein [Sandaracinaceae bacterium]|nr:acyl-CoA dehydrogenase family protein [Sandaracinaceae bacterium]
MHRDPRALAVGRVGLRARARVQGGVPIALHHEVRRMLAGMMADLAFCRDATARLCDHERASEPEASLIFAEAKRRAALATCDGVQILGGNGCMEDYPAERCMRDARQAQAIFGRADALRAAGHGRVGGGRGRVVKVDDRHYPPTRFARFTVDAERCDGCELCLATCPGQLLSMEGRCP